MNPLTKDLRKIVAAKVRDGGYTDAREVEAVVRRQMQEEAWFEQKVLEGLEGPVTPLTRDDLDSVRDLVRQARGICRR